MPQGQLGKKKNDWVLYAFIIESQGGSCSIEEMKTKLAAWKKRNATSRRIANVMAYNRKKGFQRIETRRVSVNGIERYVSIWSFSGELPEINRKTLKDWKKRISP